MARRVADQPDLFAADDAPKGDRREPGHPFYPGAAYIERIRAGLYGYLELAKRSDRLPWRKHKQDHVPDITRAYGISMDVNEDSTWLPDDEAKKLRRDFFIAMDRLYYFEGEATPMVPGDEPYDDMDLMPASERPPPRSSG